MRSEGNGVPRRAGRGETLKNKFVQKVFEIRDGEGEKDSATSVVDCLVRVVLATEC